MFGGAPVAGPLPTAPEASMHSFGFSNGGNAMVAGPGFSGVLGMDGRNDAAAVPHGMHSAQPPMENLPPATSMMNMQSAPHAASPWDTFGKNNGQPFGGVPQMQTHGPGMPDGNGGIRQMAPGQFDSMQPAPMPAAFHLAPPQMEPGQFGAMQHAPMPAAFHPASSGGYGRPLHDVQPGMGHAVEYPAMPGELPIPSEGPPCSCGQPSVQRTVRKEGPNCGRHFYCCVRPQGERCNFFQFLDEPPRPAGQMGQQQPQAEGPPCPCGVPTLQLTTRKEGPNCGRVFFKCSKPQGEQCNYFQWADEPPRTDGQAPQQQPADGPPCLCNQPTAQRTVRKEGPNMGRTFFTCVKPQGEQCGYFQWADEAPPVAGPPCGCGIPSVTRNVAKEGPNKGRPFASCSTKRCQFFQWLDEDNSSGVHGIATPARGKGAPKGAAAGDVCYKCNGTGHWASNCPNVVCQQDRQQHGAQSFGRDTGTDVCYKCNMVGHWASNCPNQPAGGKGAGKGARGQGKGAMSDFGQPHMQAQYGASRYQPF